MLLYFFLIFLYSLPLLLFSYIFVYNLTISIKKEIENQLSLKNLLSASIGIVGIILYCAYFFMR